jgi:hypothetical protein
MLDYLAWKNALHCGRTATDAVPVSPSLRAMSRLVRRHKPRQALRSSQAERSAGGGSYRAPGHVKATVGVCATLRRRQSPSRGRPAYRPPRQRALHAHGSHGSPAPGLLRLPGTDLPRAPRARLAAHPRTVLRSGAGQRILRRPSPGSVPLRSPLPGLSSGPPSGHTCRAPFTPSAAIPAVPPAADPCSDASKRGDAAAGLRRRPVRIRGSAPTLRAPDRQQPLRSFAAGASANAPAVAGRPPLTPAVTPVAFRLRRRHPSRQPPQRNSLCSCLPPATSRRPSTSPLLFAAVSRPHVSAPFSNPQRARRQALAVMATPSPLAVDRIRLRLLRSTDSLPPHVAAPVPLLSCRVLSSYGGGTRHASTPAVWLRKLRHLNAHGLRPIAPEVRAPLNSEDEAHGEPGDAPRPGDCCRAVRERAGMPTQFRYAAPHGHRLNIA